MLLRYCAKMNLLRIKIRFAKFIRSFEPDDLKLLMQFMELSIYEYNKNTLKFLGNHLFRLFFFQVLN